MKFTLLLTWPLPALLAWGVAWALHGGLVRAGMPGWSAAALAMALGGTCALAGRTRWRRLIIAGGFPLSLLASGAGAGWPPALWLLPLGLLLVLYPLNAWRDAPLFPTPAAALEGLAEAVPLPPGARVVDAGCGLGDGLRELRRAYPAARLEGLEWSWPLVLACRLLRRDALIRRADIWAADWSGYDLVYLFQRPESMARAWEKACREQRRGSWLASLEFEVPGMRATRRLQAVEGKPVWLYRIPG